VRAKEAAAADQDDQLACERCDVSHGFDPIPPGTEKFRPAFCFARPMPHAAMACKRSGSAPP
jgi:hypothetical protein